MSDYVPPAPVMPRDDWCGSCGTFLLAGSTDCWACEGRDKP